MKNIMIKMMVVVFLTGAVAIGSPALYQETWAGASTEGWAFFVTGDQGATPYSLAASGGALQLTMPADSLNAAARVYAGTTGAAANFTGDYSTFVSTLNAGFTNLLLTFNLKTVDTQNTAPNAMKLYFASGTQVYTFNQTFTQPSVGATNTYTAIIGSSGWTLAEGTPGQFAIDFANVTQFGLELMGTLDGIDRRYQLLDFQLSGQYDQWTAYLVPEPETVWMILMVLASLGITFRGRLLEIGRQALVRIKG